MKTPYYTSSYSNSYAEAILNLSQVQFDEEKSGMPDFPSQHKDACVMKTTVYCKQVLPTFSEKLQ